MWTDANASAAETPPPAGSRRIAEGDPQTPAPESTAAPESKKAVAADAAQVAAGHAARGARTAFWATVRTLSERRGLRVAVIGVGLVLLSFWLGTDSVLSLPMLIAGIILLVAGAVGPRLQGRVSVDFGPDGSLFEMKAHLAPPGHTAVPGAVVERPQPQLQAVPPPEPQTPEPAVIESHGETIELDVERLKRLLAAEDAKVAAESRPPV